MATFDFNTLMQQAKAASFEPLPAGPYDAECISADAVTSSTGKPMIKCKFEVISGPHAKRKFFNQYVLSVENETALAMFFRQMKAFGMDENFFAAVGQQGLGPVAQTMLGKRARFELGVREWQGEPRNEVKSTKPLAGGVAAGGLPGTGAAAPVGLPGLPTSTVAPVTATPPPAVTVPVAATPVAPAAVTVPVAPVVPATPATPAQPATPVTAPPPAVAPVNPVPVAVAQPAAPPAPVAVTPTAAAPVQPVTQVAPAADPQPVPPVEQAVPVGAPAVQPPPPMPF